MRRRKLSTIFKLAAKQVAEFDTSGNSFDTQASPYSCTAVFTLINSPNYYYLSPYESIAIYRDYFRPILLKQPIDWWGMPREFSTPETQLQRSLALLLMSEILKSEGL